LTSAAGATGDRKRYDHAVADPQILHLPSDLHNFAHELMTEHIALFHGGHEAVVQVQVRATDRRRRDAHDGVARVQDLRLWHLLYTNAPLTHPTVRLHDSLLCPCLFVAALNTSSSRLDR